MVNSEKRHKNRIKLNKGVSTRFILNTLKYVKNCKLVRFIFLYRIGCILSFCCFKYFRIRFKSNCGYLKTSDLVNNQFMTTFYTPTNLFVDKPELIPYIKKTKQFELTKDVKWHEQKYPGRRKRNWQFYRFYGTVDQAPCVT